MSLSSLGPLRLAQVKAKRRARKQQLSVGLTLVILGILTASPKAISAICEHKTKNYAFIWARSHQPWNGAVSVQAMLLSRGQLVLCLAVTLCYTSGEAAPIVAEEFSSHSFLLCVFSQSVICLRLASRNPCFLLVAGCTNGEIWNDFDVEARHTVLYCTGACLIQCAIASKCVMSSVSRRP